MSPLKRLAQMGPFLNDEHLHEKFQTEFPGKYQIDWYYNSSSFKFEPKLIFESPADETWFYLKYGA